jgi:glycerol dehydrogenase
VNCRNSRMLAAACAAPARTMNRLPSALRVAGFPGRYLQGPGALQALAHIVRELGGSAAVVVCDDFIERDIGARVRNRLQVDGIASVRLRFPGECTRATIAALAAEAARTPGAVVVGLGGGKTIDTAKGVANVLHARLVIAPTIASNDSATSSLVVLYDESHRVVAAEPVRRNPDVVLVDTAEIVRAPVRFFRAGIGDALSKTFEARQCRQAGGLNFFGGRPPAAAGVLADRCYALISEYGAQAVEAVMRQECNDDVETVTEATVLLSGLGFESGGLSLAHALLRGLSGVPALSNALHGEMVTFGTLVQLVLEDRPEAEIRGHLALLARMGMRATLAALGHATPSQAEMATVAELTLAAPYARNFERRLDVGTIVNAILAADRRGQAASR